MIQPQPLGFQEAGHGSGVLFLVHGFPVDNNIWESQLKGLSDQRRVIAVDLRGRGLSPASKGEEWTMNTYADDVAATVDALGVQQVDLCGLSMGGYVEFALWRRHPASIRSMILISTRSTEDPPEGKEGRLKVAALVREKGAGALNQTMLKKLLAPDADSQVKDRVRQIIEMQNPEALAADNLAMRSRPDSTVDLAGIAVPTLVLHGEHDQLIPPANSIAMAERIPGAQFSLIETAGHFAPIEAPAATNRAIQGFLNEV